MKRILFCLLASWPCGSFAQSYVNPDTIQQSGDIYIQNTDVYYCPFAPPDSTDTRELLSNISTLLRDPNGVGSLSYDPLVHGHIHLQNWCPCFDTMRGGTYPYQLPLGPYVVWQRLFQARNKPDGATSDIIAGSHVTSDTAHSRGYGAVIISKNEDVDFRATGTIKLESGFHAMPGSFFHAYIEPKWGDSVFSDDFKDTATFHNQWYVANGNADDDGTHPECSSDSNVRIVHDSDATDGYALDVILREGAGDTCDCDQLGLDYMDSCMGTILDSAGFPLPPAKNLFSTVILRSCPYPFTTTHKPLGFATYANAPYGKYEFRDKIPHVLQETNNWGGDGDLEFDLNETQWHEQMDIMMPNWGHNYRHGPLRGYFVNDSTFIAPGAHWGPHNSVTSIYIDNFNLGVYSTDSITVKPAEFNIGFEGGFPSQFIGKTFTFYYERWGGNWADNVTWTVDSTGRIFYAPFDTTGGVSKYFFKLYQPNHVTLHGYTSLGFDTEKVHACHWIESLNDPVNYGKIYLDDPVAASDPHSFTESYFYSVQENAGYNIPPVLTGPDSIPDSAHVASYAHEPYKYHTFTMEMLPHEVRILYDSVIVRRIPDRLIPPGNKFYDWAGTFARNEVHMHPAEFDMTMNGDPFGRDSTLDPHYGTLKAPYIERKFFEQYDTSCSGCWPVPIGVRNYPAAHHLLDYVKVWDLPADVKLQPFMTH